MDDDIKWLHRFLNASVFGPPPSDIQRAHEIVNRLSQSTRPEARTLFDSDAYCPSCGHNRDKSCVSSIDHEDGTRSCQMCGARWREMQSTPQKETP